VVQRWILARLRHQRFFPLAELNGAIAELVEQLNDRTMRGLGTTRRALFEQFDRPALLPLPPVAYEFAEWRRCRVGLDYHVAIDKHFYSVPHELLRQEVEARITAGTVELFHRGKRVASHVRSADRQRPSTVAEHMPTVRSVPGGLLALRSTPFKVLLPVRWRARVRWKRGRARRRHRRIPWVW